MKIVIRLYHKGIWGIPILFSSSRKSFGVSRINNSRNSQVSTVFTDRAAAPGLKSGGCGGYLRSRLGQRAAVFHYEFVCTIRFFFF